MYEAVLEINTTTKGNRDISKNYSTEVIRKDVATSHYMIITFVNFISHSLPPAYTNQYKISNLMDSN